MQIFEKMSQMALNRVLTLPDCRSQSQLSESGLRSQKRSIGRRAVIILLQEKNFGPNVIHYVFMRDQ